MSRPGGGTTDPGGGGSGLGSSSQQQQLPTSTTRITTTAASPTTATSSSKLQSTEKSQQSQHQHQQHLPPSDHFNESLQHLAIADATSPAISATPSSPHYEIFGNFPQSSFTSMKYRNLGKSGLKVPLVGLAVWTTFGTRMTDQAAEELINMAYEHGVNYFDTGDAFGNGRCELVLGNVLRRKNWRRNSFLVSTKLFWSAGPSASPAAPGLSRKFIIEAVDASLKRLQLSYVDILIVNKLDGMCPMEEIVRGMQHILDKGQAMYWGTSRWSPVHIMEAFTVARQFNLTPPSVEQMEYHMFTRDKMELYMPELYHKLGVGVISWSPHSLSNDDGIQLISRRAASSEDRQLRTTKQLELNPISVKLGCDSVQMSIAWSLRNDNTNCVLISPRTADQLYLHLNSLKILPKLNLSLMDDMDKILNNKPSIRRGTSTTINASTSAMNTNAEAVALTATSQGPDESATTV